MRFCESSDPPAAIPINRCPWMASVLNGGLRPGSSYVLTGEPGGCKTTLWCQIAASLAAQGVKVLAVLTEQTPAEVAAILSRVTQGYPQRALRSAWRNLDCETLDRPEDLARVILPKLDREYSKTRVVVVDSVQGNGLPSTATRAYREVLSFIGEAKARGLTSILISHVNKGNRLAGPRAFEHVLDVLVQLRKVFNLRHLVVAKNRFGPELVDPLALELVDGRLEPSPHQGDHNAVVLGFDAQHDELLELQAGVSLPKLGRRGELNAPFLPTRRLRLLLSVLSRLPGIDLSDLTYTLNAYVPVGFAYSGELDLPLAIAMLAAYLRRPVPAHTLFVGQVDLRRQIRPPTTAYMQLLTNVLGTQVLAGVQHIILSSATAGFVADSLSSASRIKVSGAATIDELIGTLWPDLFAARPVTQTKAGCADSR